FRLAAPFTFVGPELFSLSINPHVVAGYADIYRWVGDFSFPPSWQWMTGYGAPAAVGDLAIWGLGIVTVLAVVFGAVALARERATWLAAVPGLVLIGAFSAYWLAGHVPALRYVLPAVPALCIIAGGTALLLPS